MTVCVAGMSATSDAAIVAVSDMMLSAGDMASDKLSIKWYGIGTHWMTMFAGSDLSPIPLIIKSARNAVKAQPESLEAVVEAMTTGYASARNRKAEQLHLRPLGLTIQTLRGERKELGPEVFSRLIVAVQETQLDLTFLVYGFDESGVPHIFSVHNPGCETIYDSVGFWAIGCGETAALGSLFNCGHNMFARLPQLYYRLCEAKFVAESVPGVGQETLGHILHADGSREVVYLTRNKLLKEVWKKNRITEAPPEAIEMTQSFLDKAAEERKQKALTAKQGKR